VKVKDKEITLLNFVLNLSAIHSGNLNRLDWSHRTNLKLRKANLVSLPGKVGWNKTSLNFIA